MADTRFEEGDTVVVDDGYGCEQIGEVVEVRPDESLTYVVERRNIPRGKAWCTPEQVTDVAGTSYDHSDVPRPVTKVYIGCGKAKRDLTGHPNHAENQYAAANLYTSNYFRLKRAYAVRAGYSWNILSAKFGCLPPYVPVCPYDLTISDYPLDEENDYRDPEFQTLEAWADHVVEQVESDLSYFENHDKHPPLDRLEFLAGRDYLEPIRDRVAGLAREYDARLVCPFDDTEGIGEQMGWLKEDTDPTEPVTESYWSLFQDELPPEAEPDGDTARSQAAELHADEPRQQALTDYVAGGGGR